jgi:Putative peptidoglycan binding domain
VASDLLDAVEWQALLPLPDPVACYRDGPVSQWSAQGVAELAKRIAVNITVLADERWEAFDAETGNASNAEVATAVANRTQDGRWSWCYTDGDNCPNLTANLRAKGLAWSDASLWPHPGAYLWAAAPGQPPGTLPTWCPVRPVAVQDRRGPGYDISTVVVDLGWHPPTPPPPPPPPPPQPTPEVPITVQLLQVQEGNQGDAVRALQILLNGRGPYALATDGIFGPRTEAAVRGYQDIAHIGVDGIAGVHTWGHLLGVPQ